MKILIFDYLPIEYIDDVCKLYKRVFSSSLSIGELEDRTGGKKNLYVGLVKIEDEIVGFKIGYESKKDTFYSWIGGIDPDYRKQGAATALLNNLENYCRGKGYKYLLTQTKNKFKDMLILNLKSNFNIIGYYEEYNEGKILLRKDL